MLSLAGVCRDYLNRLESSKRTFWHIWLLAMMLMETEEAGSSTWTVRWSKDASTPPVSPQRLSNDSTSGSWPHEQRLTTHTILRSCHKTYCCCICCWEKQNLLLTGPRNLCFLKCHCRCNWHNMTLYKTAEQPAAQSWFEILSLMKMEYEQGKTSSHMPVHSVERSEVLHWEISQ